MEPKFRQILPVTLSETSLRLFRVGDADLFQRYRNDPEVGRFQGWTPLTPASTVAFIEEMSALGSFRRGKWIQLAIANSGDDVLIGDLGVWISSDGTESEIGFTIDPGHQRCGHARRTLKLICDLLFTRTSVEVIRGICDERNVPSQRTLKSAGFSLSARNETIFRGEPCVEFTYELNASGLFPASLR